MVLKPEQQAPVVLIPVNGLGNRLRAISGAYALSLLHRRPLVVAWDPEPHLPDDVFELFDARGPVDFRRYRDVVDAGLLPNSEIPLYLQQTESFITLRGYGKGEQRFISALSRKMKAAPETSVVIKAGDYFSPKASSRDEAGRRLRRIRKSLYGRIFSREIVGEASQIVGDDAHIGLSLRGSDLSDRVPPLQLFLKKVLEISHRIKTRTVYVSSESSELHFAAKAVLAERGLRVIRNPTPTWIHQTEEVNARIPISGRQALIDFAVLGRSRHYVGPKASTFVTEIAVTRPNFSSTLL